MKKESGLQNTSGSKKPLRVFFCGAPTQNSDYAILTRLAEKGGTCRWASLSAARNGDRVLFYTVHERQAFMASGWILENAKRTNDRDDYPYRAKVGHVRLLKEPVSIHRLRSWFPNWKWSLYTRNITTVPEEIADRVWRVVHTAGASLPPRSPSNRGSTEQSVGAGAGFGSAESNRVVEKAAIKAATRLLRKRGYTVKSIERLNLGYDLEATGPGGPLHVEVKGATGYGSKFIITQNELATSRIDPNFRLWLVNGARTKSARITEFTPQDLKGRFQLTPISYSAELR